MTREQKKKRTREQTNSRTVTFNAGGKDELTRKQQQRRKRKI